MPSATIPLKALFEAAFALVLITSSTSSRAQPLNSRPNIIWIVCEDMSPYLGAYGNKEVRTPNIDQLAKEGVRYTHAYTVAGVCAPSRSGIITGMYPTSIGTQHMRTSGNPKYQPVPLYSAVIPEYVKCFPEYLRKVGYYCTNNEKQDYQFDAPVTVWDENSISASWKNRPSGAPFFSVFNFAITHESQLFERSDTITVDSARVIVPPIYPDNGIVRHDIARLYSNIEHMDKQVGELLALLKNDSVYDNSIIFFYSDHGGALPWSKREILERGTHIPLIIRFPGAKGNGTVNDEMVSSVDFAPTILSIADIPIPGHLQGQAFLGKQKSTTPRQYVFAGRDRMDTEYDRVRMVRDKQYRYIRNYMPDKPYYQNATYRLSVPMMKEILRLKEENKLDPVQRSWFETKSNEELYDVVNDPYEIRNLLKDTLNKELVAKLNELSTELGGWIQKYGDRSEVDEMKMIHEMWGGKSRPPKTKPPDVTPFKGGVRLGCTTAGASIGYQVIGVRTNNQPASNPIFSWDFESLSGKIQNGTSIPSPPSWMVYDGELIPLQHGDTLHIQAMRIGFLPSETVYVQN